MLSKLDIQLIRHSAGILAESDIAVTSQFYLNLFDTVPAVRPLFPQDMFEQSEKLWASILVVVDSIEDIDAMRPKLVDLGRRHAQYGAEPAHYQVVKSVLIETLSSFVGNGWTPAHRAAWERALGFVVSCMLEGSNAAAA